MSEKKVKSNEITNQYGASMDKIASLAKRRGFVYPSSEIYGGLAATWDYGPLGIELKRKIQEIWWRRMVYWHENIVGLDAAIMMHPRTWEASGHIENFSDPLVDCKKCKTRFRADKLDEKALESKVCPLCKGELTDAREFNLMFSTHLGPVVDSGSKVYLRPETAQGIFVNFKNVLDTNRLTVPFGIAQVGKAFRNEITTKSFIFRTCEFEQMEMQFFVKPGEEDKWFEYWRQERYDYYVNLLGVNPKNLKFTPHGPNELAHYAKDAVDIEYHYPHGWEELEGIHSRTDFDLSRHNEFSGKPSLTYRDATTNEKYIPYVIETSAGLTRSVLITLMDAYEEQNLAKEGEKEDIRTVLHLHPSIAPYTVALLPLVKKDGLAELAHDIMKDLSNTFNCFYDKQGAIGRRYRRMDEIGTPFCVTVDYDSLEKKTVTLRYRDSMKQEIIAIDELETKIKTAIKEYSPYVY